jgi:hypothetical protein
VDEVGMGFNGEARIVDLEQECGNQQFVSLVLDIWGQQGKGRGCDTEGREGNVLGNPVGASLQVVAAATAMAIIQDWANHRFVFLTVETKNREGVGRGHKYLQLELFVTCI